jgi:hypothetical protein
MPSLFKTVGAVLCLVFALCFAVPNASADSFTPIFTTFGCSGTCLLPTALDVTFPSPTTIDVTFDGLTESVAIPSGDLPGDTYSWSASATLGPHISLSFNLFDNANGDGVGSCGGLQTSFGAFSCGNTLTFAGVSTATPEPSSLALMLSGVGLVFAMRKRWTSGLQQAS